MGRSLVALISPLSGGRRRKRAGKGGKGQEKSWAIQSGFRIGAREAHSFVYRPIDALQQLRIGSVLELSVVAVDAVGHDGGAHAREERTEPVIEGQEVRRASAREDRHGALA